MKKRHGIWQVLACLLVSVFLVTELSACSSIRRTTMGGKAVASPEADTQTVTGVVIKNETDVQQIQLQELDSDVIDTLTYGASSDIQNQYQEAIDGEKIEIGQILEVNYRRSDARLVSAAVPENVWEYRDVHKFSFSSDDSMMQVAGEKYQYSSMTYFGADGMAAEPMEFNDQDVLTVRGIGIYVYSVVQTAGHGYIRLANYQDFIGGIAEVTDDMMVPISENMLITVAEGTYRLTLCKNGAATTKTVTVKENEEVIADFSGYKATASNVGEVTFNIEPDGAALYLNGTAVKYDKPISLRYGKYKVVVSLTGYETYSGILEVAEASKTVHIDLTEAQSDTSSATATPSAATPTPSPAASSNNSSSDSTVTKKIDSKHTITVTAPEGAEVYLDNVYKGMAPCTFTKVIGSQTITLSDTGYVTKSYSVDILDDNKNVKYSFADLVKDSTGTSSSTDSSTSDSTTSK